MSQRRFDLVLKSKLVITPGIVQPPEAMGLQEDRVAELHPRSVVRHIKKPGNTIALYKLTGLNHDLNLQ